MGIDRTVLFRLATSERLERVLKRVPGGEAAAWRPASRYVSGGSREDALTVAGGLLDAGHGVSIDSFGEQVSDPAVADRVLDDYLELADRVSGLAAGAWLSLSMPGSMIG